MERLLKRIVMANIVEQNYRTYKVQLMQIVFINEIREEIADRSS